MIFFLFSLLCSGINVFGLTRERRIPPFFYFVPSQSWTLSTSCPWTPSYRLEYPGFSWISWVLIVLFLVFVVFFLGFWCFFLLVSGGFCLNFCGFWCFFSWIWLSWFLNDYKPGYWYLSYTHTRTWISIFLCMPVSKHIPNAIKTGNKAHNRETTVPFPSSRLIDPTASARSPRAVLLYASHYDTYNQPDCLHYFVQHKLLHRWSRHRHRWDVDSFSSAVPYHGAQHIWYAARSIFALICLSLYIEGTICHPATLWLRRDVWRTWLVRSFRQTRLAGRLGPTRTSHLTVEENAGRRGRWRRGRLEMGDRKEKEKWDWRESLLLNFLQPTNLLERQKIKPVQLPGFCTGLCYFKPKEGLQNVFSALSNHIIFFLLNSSASKLPLVSRFLVSRGQI